MMWRKALLLIVVVAAGWFLLHTSFLQELDLRQRLLDFFSIYGLWAWPLFGLGCVGFTAVGGSRQLVALAAGVLLGGWWGTLISTVLTLVGALVTIAVSQYLAPAWLYRRFGRQLAGVQQLLLKRTWLWVCTLRLMPVGSNVLTNLACGMAKLPLQPVLLGSAIGYLPQMLLFSFIGSGLALNDGTELVLSVVLLIGSMLLGTVLLRQSQKSLVNAGFVEPSDAN